MPKVKELLSKPENWTQGSYAKDRYGDSVGNNNPDAICWCLLGAIKHCYPIGPLTAESDAAEYNRVLRLVRKATKIWITEFNDRPKTTHQMVLNLVTQLDV